VTAISQVGAGFALDTPQGGITASRILMATGAWLKPTAAMLGVDLPVNARINTVSVTERLEPLISTVIGHATGLLTMKQKTNGTVLIGGGWQGRGTPQEGRGEVTACSVQPNLALAQFALPALANARVMRSWTGFEANVPDFYPLAGALPGVEGAFVLGCVRGGYTIGPYISKLMGDFILDREPELPLFDLGRNFNED
jgi:glycine/D-amino acid oxidase-like deaminating enzyme